MAVGEVLTTIGAGFEGLKTAKEFYDKHLAGLLQARSDRFLNYDPGFLCRAYAKETPIANGIPYTKLGELELAQLVPLNEMWRKGAVELCLKSDFKLDPGGTLWRSASSAGFTALQQSKRIKENEPTIRVCKAEIKKDDENRPKSLSLTLQKAMYYDQAASNLILDFDRDNPGSHYPLRQQLLSQPECDSGLPPLEDGRLANTLGVACLVFYYDDKHQLIPYFVKRVRDVAVFPGAVHCTASGVARWPEDEKDLSLDNFATRHMLSELDEEVGLKPEDLIDFRPVALCREMARGGKPQVFYAGFTKLNRNELLDRRKTAYNTIKDTKQWQEVERDAWFRSADVVPSLNWLNREKSPMQFTLEGAASLFLGLKYANARGHRWT